MSAMPQTSLDAHASMFDHMGAIEARIVKYVHEKGFLGATCDRVEADLHISHQTCSSAFTRLMKRGTFKRSTVRRETRSGRKAFVILHKDYMLFEAPAP